jgi:hypothetical protein
VSVVLVIGQRLEQPDYPTMPRILCRVWSDLWGRRAPLIALLGNLSYRSNLRLNCRSYAEFNRQRGHMFTGPA